MPLTRRALAAGLLAAPLAAPLAVRRASAQGWPDRPLRIIVSFPPGGSSDLLARAVGRELTAAFGQPVVADNRAGANGTIAAGLVAQAPPDGLTIGLVAIGHAVNPLLYRNLSYDTDRDLAPLSLLARYPQTVLVAPGLPVQDIGGLIRLGRQRMLTYASGGNGSSQHLAGALFASLAGLRLNHVPYRGGAPALLDVMAGTVDMIITQPTLDQLRNGEVRAVAVTSAQRLPWAPTLPTLAEAGLAGYESVAWYGLVAPRGLPPEVAARLSQAIMAAMRSPAVRDVVATQGGEPVGSTAAAFASYIQAERQRYAPLIPAAGIRSD